MSIVHPQLIILIHTFHEINLNFLYVWLDLWTNYDISVIIQWLTENH